MPGTEEHSEVLNLWTGWAVSPKSGDCSAWLELLRDVICGGDAMLTNWMMHWFANIVREPQHKLLTCPVLIGVEGAGKSMLIEYFGKILGACYVMINKEEHIHGQFNAHQGNCLLLHSEEALYGGDVKHAGIIRALITNPTQMYEQKGIDAYQVSNFLRLVLTSNKVHAAPVMPGDRRYTVVLMGDRKASPELVARLLEEIRGDGPAALFQHFLDMNYDPTVARINVKNDDLLTLKSINMDALEAWWHEVLMDGRILPDYLAWATKPEKEDWPSVVSGPALYAAMTIKMKERNVRTIPIPVRFAYHMEKFVGHKLVRFQRDYSNPLPDDAPPIVKQLNERQSSITNMPSLADCRIAFEKHLGQKIEWPGDDEPKKFKPKEPHENY